VLVVQELGGPRPGRPPRRRRRAQPAAPAEPETVPVTRATVTGTAPFRDAAGAKEWLARVGSDKALRGEEVREATQLLNRALGALRAASGDPLVQDVGATKALAIRLGWGDGDEISEGRWTEALLLPATPHGGRLEGVDPQSRVAAVLAGRDRVHPAETLLERARLDIQQRRPAEARLCLRAARAAIAEDRAAGAEKLLARIAEAEGRLDG
jgi:hypothetical protein